MTAALLTDLTEAEKYIVRAWSEVVARGLEGSPSEVAVELRAKGQEPRPDLWKQLLDLQVRGHLP